MKSNRYSTAEPTIKRPPKAALPVVTPVPWRSKVVFLAGLAIGALISVLVSIVFFGGQ